MTDKPKPTATEILCAAMRVIFKMHDAAMNSGRDEKDPHDVIADIADVLRATKERLNACGYAKR